MTTNVYLVRHAHSVYTPEERTRPLSMEGIKAADRVAACLASYPIDVILSSPYLRAIQTVKPLAEQVEKPVIPVEDFKERTLSERGVEDFDSAIKKVWEEDGFSWPGGESNTTARNRGQRALQEVLSQYERQNVVIGTHGNIMTLTMQAFDDSFDFSFWQQLSMPDIYQLSFNGLVLKDVKRVWHD